jgi:lipoyl(octanoyl) transferase
MIRATAEFGIASRRVSGRTGVWVDVAGGSAANGGQEVEEVKEVVEVKDEEKLAAIGVHLSRWVTSHGFAYNVSTDLRYFDLIVPCGIAGKRATSLEKLLNRRVEMKEAATRIAAHFGEIFGLGQRTCSRDALDTLLRKHEDRMVLAAV